MHQQGEGSILQAVGVIVIHFQPFCDRLLFKFEHLSVAGEVTPVDQVIPLAAVRCSQVEVVRQINNIRIQIIIKEKMQRLAVAVKFKVGK